MLIYRRVCLDILIELRRWVRTALIAYLSLSPCRIQSSCWQHHKTRLPILLGSRRLNLVVWSWGNSAACCLFYAVCVCGLVSPIPLLSLQEMETWLSSCSQLDKMIIITSYVLSIFLCKPWVNGGGEREGKARTE